MNANIVILTDSDNGKEVTVPRGGILLVRLEANETTGFSWHALVNPSLPFHLEGGSHAGALQAAGMVGGGRVQELRFSIAGDGASFTAAAWLRLLLLRPFERSIDGAQQWAVKITVPGEA